MRGGVMDKKQRITIKYSGKLNKDLDERIAGFFEFPPLNFEWIGQGYNHKKKLRDISFEREVGYERD